MTDFHSSKSRVQKLNTTCEATHQQNRRKLSEEEQVTSYLKKKTQTLLISSLVVEVQNYWGDF